MCRSWLSIPLVPVRARVGVRGRWRGFASGAMGIAGDCWISGAAKLLLTGNGPGDCGGD